MTATAPTTAKPIPFVEGHPKYLAALGAVNRLAAEVSRLEKELAAQQEIANEIREQERHVARKLVDGATLAQVRVRPTDGVVGRILTDLHHARKGEELARKEFAQAEREVAHELATEFAAEFRNRLRSTAVAYVSFARTMAEHTKFIDQVRERGILTGPCSDPFPGFGADNPTEPDSRFSYVLRDLLDLGVLNAKEDAALLAGLACQPKYVPPPPPPPPVPKVPTEEGRRFGRALRRLGVQFGLAES